MQFDIKTTLIYGSIVEEILWNTLVDSNMQRTQLPCVDSRNHFMG
jgi:hypothetical protein